MFVDGVEVVSLGPAVWCRGATPWTPIPVQIFNPPTGFKGRPPQVLRGRKSILDHSMV